MESMVFCSCSRSFVFPLLSRFSASQKPRTRISAIRKDTVFPEGKPGPRQSNYNGQTVPLLSNVEKLRLLTKAEKAGLLSLAERFGLSLSSVERLGLLSKAEELGILSAATNQATPTTLLTLSLVLLLLGPAFVFLVPEENAWEVALQVVVALVSILGGSTAFAVSNFLSNLQRSS